MSEIGESSEADECEILMTILVTFEKMHEKTKHGAEAVEVYQYLSNLNFVKINQNNVIFGILTQKLMAITKI